MNSLPKFLLVILVAAAVAGCAAKGPEMKTVEHVEIDRFMGAWYVIANIPTFLEKGAFNAVETYSLNDDGTIATNFVFNKDGFDGKTKEYSPKGFVLDHESNARWGMRFVWPIKADYRIVYLDDDYSQTIVARQARDYVWIMARTPTVSDADYDRLFRGSMEAAGLQGLWVLDSLSGEVLATGHRHRVLGDQGADLTRQARSAGDRTYTVLLGDQEHQRFLVRSCSIARGGAHLTLIAGHRFSDLRSLDPRQLVITG